MKGIAWTGAMRWGAQALSWASTLVVAHLLSPTDYGLVAMALVYLGLAQLINEFGLGTVIVMRRDLTESQVARLGGLSLLLGTGFLGLSALLAGPVAGFFGEPTVRWLILVSSVTFVTGALQVVPRALLAKDLDFRRLAWADGTEALLTTCATLTLALLGLGYWALVLGPIVGRTSGTIVVNVWRPHRVAWPRDFGSIAGAVAFGWHVVAARIAWYLYSNADFAVVGRVLGKAPLGAYTFGWQISSIPIERVTALVMGVTGPVFSAVQTDKAALQRYLRNLSEGLAFITFPVAVGLALVADEFVLTLLGEHWRPAIVPLRFLALSAAIRSVTPLLPQIIVSTGYSKRNMQFTMVATVVMPLLFYLSTRWGTEGVALAWVLGYPLFVLPMFLGKVLRITGMTLGGYVRVLSPAAGATCVMSAAVIAVRALTPDAWPAGSRLASQALAGAATYGAVLYVAHRGRIREFLGLVRSLRN
ncbi:MAG TPA: lipopolysaccharide biosynthesis protein [Gemmatimonadales bacterium]|nr:lipopolysaccharide biosynthesis protein [Gemmatimonadales bacterium]